MQIPKHSAVNIRRVNLKQFQFSAESVARAIISRISAQLDLPLPATLRRTTNPAETQTVSIATEMASLKRDALLSLKPQD